MPKYRWFNNTLSLRREFSARSGFSVQAVRGLSLPDKDHISARAPEQHGATYVDTFFRPRLFSLTIAIIGCNAAEFADRHRRLVKAINPLDNGELRIEDEDGTLYTLTCRPVTSIELNRHNARIGSALIQMIADDPFFHTAQQSLAATSAVTLGLTIPFTIPAVISSPTNTATFAVSNNGHVAVFPTIVVNGPVTNPQLINVTDSETLTISETVAAGDVLTVNMGDRTAVITGAGGSSQNVLGSVTGTWWDLEIGASSVEVTSEALDIFTATLQFREAFLAAI